MRVIVERAALLAAATAVSRFAVHNGTVLILKNIKIEVRNSEIKLSGTDLDTLAIATVPADAKESGVFTVQAKLFTEMLRRTPEGAQVRLADGEEANSVVIEAGRSRARILTLPVSDFPDLESSFDDGVAFAVQGQMLQRLLRRVAFASPGHGGTKLFHAGIYFHVVRKRFRLAATDSNLFAVAEGECPAGAEKMPGVIVHADLCREIDRMAGEAGERELDLNISGKLISIEHAGLRIQAKLIDAPFPEYERAIPEGNPHKVVAPTAELLRAFERCGALALIEGEKKSYNRGVKLEIEPGKIVVSKQNHQLGATRDEIECDYAGDGITIGLNHEYLEGILRAAGTDRVRLELSEPQKPVVVRAEGDDSVTFLVGAMNAS